MARIEPFDMSAIMRGDDGIKRCENRPRSLIEMLRQSVDAVATKEAVVEVGGERITFGDLWDRAYSKSSAINRVITDHPEVKL
jgi:hypothetical protein